MTGRTRTTAHTATNPCWIQAAALTAAIEKRMREDPATAGFAARIEISALPDADDTVIVHFDIDRTGWRHPCISIERAWYPEAPDVVASKTLAFALDAAHHAIRRSMEGATPDLTPSWAVLAHPLVVSLAVAHEPDRARLPLSRRSKPAPHEGRSDRWTVDDTGDPAHPGRCGVATGELSLADGVLHANSLGTLVPVGGEILSLTAAQRRGGRRDGSPTTLCIPRTLPATLGAAAIGRRLAEVVLLHRTGHADIDDAVDALVIAAIEPLANGMQMAFKPARLIPYGVPPGERQRRAMALAPAMG